MQERCPSHNRGDIANPRVFLAFLCSSQELLEKMRSGTLDRETADKRLSLSQLEQTGENWRKLLSV